MTVSGNTSITYGQLTSSVYNSLLGIVQNVGAAYNNVPAYLQYPHDDVHAINRPDRPTGYQMYVHWNNTDVASLIPELTFQTDYNNFISSQGLLLNLNADTVITTHILTKVLTALYCYITTRLIRVYHPYYTGSAIFFNISLQPVINTSNVVDFSVTMDTGTIQLVVTYLLNQSVRSIKSHMVVSTYIADWNPTPIPNR